jgi:hypothetical protein
MIYARLKRITGAPGYVSEIIIGRLGIALHTRIERNPYVAPTFVFEVRLWVTK